MRASVTIRLLPGSARLALCGSGRFGTLPAAGLSYPHPRRGFHLVAQKQLKVTSLMNVTAESLTEPALCREVPVIRPKLVRAAAGCLVHDFNPFNLQAVTNASGEIRGQVVREPRA